MPRSDIDEVIDFFEGIEEELSNPQSFFTAHEHRYLEMARRIGVQTLNALRPAEMDADLWRENAVEFSEMIFTRHLAPGLEIGFAGRAEFDRVAARNRGGNPANYTPITYQDVLDWVQAGPEEGGKDLSAIEHTRERSPFQIAYDVHQAVLQHRLGTEKKDFSRIAGRLEEWVNSRLMAGDMNELLKAVLEAWSAVLYPTIARDFEDWITYDVLGS